MNENEIIADAIADATADQLAIRATIIMLADRNLRATPAYRAAIKEFRIISLELRELRAML